jgi:hypothetical protein
MRITNVQLERQGERVTLSARCKIRPVGWDRVFFSFEKKYEPFLFTDASPFAAALLIPSMFLCEPLQIEGTISRELREGLTRAMETFLSWKLPHFRRISIEAAKTERDPERASGVATFFSGGVDSFYTYVKHKDDTVDPIRFFILVRGNDIDIRNCDLWKATRDNVRAIARDGGIEVIEVFTNIQATIEPIVSPDYTHGGALAAVGLCLRKGLGTIYIPATFAAGQQPPYGSHPDLDPLWSAEAVRFIHDGNESKRGEKVERISLFPAALKYLRVCYMNVRGKYNCGQCEKCLRTMSALAAAGKLAESATFPHSIDLPHLTKTISHAVNSFVTIGHGDNLAALQRKGIEPELQAAIAEGLRCHATPKPERAVALFKRLVYLDHMYTRGILYMLYRTVLGK